MPEEISPEDTEDEEEDEELKPELPKVTRKNVLSVGDIQMSSTELTIPKLRKQIETICKSKPIKAYLQNFTKTKFKMPSGVG